MEPYHIYQQKQADKEATRDGQQQHRRHDGHGQEQSDRQRQYYQHHQHYFPPPPPPQTSQPYGHYYYPHYYPPVPTPWNPPPSRPAVPVTDDTKPHRQDKREDHDDDVRKRPARLNARNDSDGSRKLDPYEPIPWSQAQTQPMLIASETQALASTVLPAASKQSAPPKLKSPPEDPFYNHDRRRSFSPITFGSDNLAGDQNERADSIWDIRYKELAAFKLKYGHCNVPQKYAANKSLGIWVNKQRMEYNKRIDGKKRSSLNDSRLEKLESLGFRWAKRKGQSSWESHFDALVAYKEKFGHCSVPTKYKDDTALGRWVSTQRAEYKKKSEGEPSAITADRITRLEEIGFTWWMGA